MIVKNDRNSLKWLQVDIWDFDILIPEKLLMISFFRHITSRNLMKVTIIITAFIKRLLKQGLRSAFDRQSRRRVLRGRHTNPLTPIKPNEK